MYVGMYVCSYVYTANISQATMDILMIKVSSYTKKNLYGHIVNLGPVFLKIIQLYVSWYAVRTLKHGGT